MPEDISGVGVGLRSPHIQQILQHQPDIPWLELLADNCLADGGLIPAQLTAIRDLYPLTLHSVGMSLGSLDPLDIRYIKKIKQLADTYEAAWVSDHCCFCGVHGYQVHDLLPLPYTEEALKHMVPRIAKVQDILGQQLVLENVSSYISYTHSALTEAEFLRALAEAADCLLLLDLNNFYVSEVNHQQSSLEMLQQLPLHRIREIHLAGYEDKQDYLIDAHNNPVSQPVWQLYEQALDMTGPIATLIEWDNNIPALDTLLAEATKAAHIMQTHLELKHATA